MGDTAKITSNKGAHVINVRYVNCCLKLPLRDAPTHLARGTKCDKAISGHVHILHITNIVHYTINWRPGKIVSSLELSGIYNEWLNMVKGI